ncbi:MAG TPA: BamA/TamA family outer membrane protein [bacterium]|nr:BamA/TamA family outer membrane protein [bacterium]
MHRFRNRFRGFISLVIGCVLIMNASHIFAGETDENSDNSEEKNWGIAPVVVPFYSPETGFGGVVSGILYWNADRSAARPDQFSLTAVYTEKDQFFTGLNLDKYFIGDRLLAEINLGFNDWVNSFYGIGGNPPPGFDDSYEEEFKSSGYNINSGLAVKLVEGMYLGVDWTYSDTDMDEFESGGWLESSDLTGLNGGIISGPGATLTVDTRDEAFYPGRGILFEAEYRRFDEAFGSDYSFDSASADFRIYHSLRSGHILAAHAEVEYTGGDVPFYRLPSLSSRSSMRGVEDGVFIDKTRYAVQTEYRFPIWRRLGGAVFAAGGNVAPALDDLGDDIHFAGGFGLRYTIETRKHINIRLDIGFDEDGEANVYFTLREAF